MGTLVLLTDISDKDCVYMRPDPFRTGMKLVQIGLAFIRDLTDPFQTQTGGGDGCGKTLSCVEIHFSFAV